MMLCIVEWRIIYCKKSVIKPKVNGMYFAVWMFKGHDCRIIFMKINIFVHKEKYFSS